jgi:hypothetical protein
VWTTLDGSVWDFRSAAAPWAPRAGGAAELLVEGAESSIHVTGGYDDAVHPVLYYEDSVGSLDPLHCQFGEVDCSGHGLCYHPPGLGATMACKCDWGWGFLNGNGAACAVPSCPDCGPHGACVQGSSENGATCQCESEWVGLGCDTRTPAPLPTDDGVSAGSVVATIFGVGIACGVVGLVYRKNRNSFYRGRESSTTAGKELHAKEPGAFRAYGSDAYQQM